MKFTILEIRNNFHNKKILFATIFSLMISFANGQAIPIKDTVISLGDIVIRSYESDKKLLETPAAISILNQKALSRFSGASLVPAVNTLPGVRMEERSPGSYRLSMRGSLLRSPFGIRNVKIYRDDIPFTDAGGNSYLNLFDVHSIGMMEFTKGPAGSLYGANTGGAVLVYDEQDIASLAGKKGISSGAGIEAGSYGLFGENVFMRSNTSRGQLQVGQSYIQTYGYRDQASMRRDNIDIHDKIRLDSNSYVRVLCLLSDLQYGTPGGLTYSEMLNDPKQARPAAGTTPGALEQKAMVFNKGLFGAIQYNGRFVKGWKNTSSLFTNMTNFTNPAIATYEIRYERSYGGRTVFTNEKRWGPSTYKLIAGAEIQNTHSNISNHVNNRGEPAALQTSDQVNASQQFYFSQLEFDLLNKVYLNLGLSYNNFKYHYKRVSDSMPLPTNKKFDPVWLPRVALLYKLNKNIAVFTSAGKGYSTPTIAEVRPTDRNIYFGLQSEWGWSYEAGTRGNLFNDRMYFDINAFYFKLINAIVRRVNATGGEYFVNSGGTDQKGVEGMMSLNLLRQEKNFVQSLKLWGSAVINNFTFRNYMVTNLDYSGNELTGVTKNQASTGIDAQLSHGLSSNLVFSYTGKIPLTDANNVYAGDYRLLSAKLSWHRAMNKIAVDIYAGADNLFDQSYSLGNDINAAGNRFYNPAAGRNYFAGIDISNR